MDPLEKPSHAFMRRLVPRAGLGHLYIGEKRGGPLLIAGLLLILMWMTWFSFTLVPLLGLVLFCMGDAFLTVSRDRGLFP